MAKSPPSSPFYWNDYFRDTRVLSLSTRAIWMDMLCRAHESRTRGKVTLTIDEWAQWCACGQLEILAAEAELRRHGIGLVSKKLTHPNAKPNAYITVINRRMVREEKARINNTLRQKRFYDHQKPNANLTGNLTATKRQPNTVPSSSSSSSSDKTKILVAPSFGDNSGDKSGTGLTRLSEGLKAIFVGKLPQTNEGDLSHA